LAFPAERQVIGSNALMCVFMAIYMHK